MDDNTLVQLVCGNCGRAHPDSLAHLKAQWNSPFPCGGGCGEDMWLDRKELIAAIDADADVPLVVRMHKEKRD